MKIVTLELYHEFFHFAIFCVGVIGPPSLQGAGILLCKMTGGYNFLLLHYYLLLKNIPPPLTRSPATAAVSLCRFATFPSHCEGIDPCPTFGTPLIFNFQLYIFNFPLKKGRLSTCLFLFFISFWIVLLPTPSVFAHLFNTKFGFESKVFLCFCAVCKNYG